MCSYIDLLKQPSADVKWNKPAAEHYVETKYVFVYFTYFIFNFRTQRAFYPSLVSIEMRLKLAQELNIGVAIWEMGQGLDYFFNLF
jgi:chitinase domain-containing protein 1